MTLARWSLLALVTVAALISATSASSGREATTYRIDHVTDGDTVVLRNGQKIRLVQIDTPEVFFGTECYGPQASATTERLLPVGTRVRLMAEPATDRVDQYGRLLRYVIRVSDGVDVNVRLVALGAAAPYFYNGRRGRYANRLEGLAKRAKARRLGLWGACPRTVYDPYRGIETQR
jgi:endonuclease YncB( thermonuclease family)